MNDRAQNTPIFEAVAINDRLYPRKNTFDVFLERFDQHPICCNYHPGRSPFRTEWVAAGIGSGAAIRWSPSAHTMSRGDNEIADSVASGGYGVFFCLAGNAVMQQNSKTFDIKRGHALIYDIDVPTKIDMSGSDKNDFVNVVFLREKDNIVRTPGQLLSNCLLTQWSDLLASALERRSSVDLQDAYAAGNSLFDAHLYAAQPDDGCFAWSLVASEEILSRLKTFVINHAGNANLSPEVLASYFNISLRYVHKLFAMKGLTVQGFINETRLHYAMVDLVSTRPPMTITSIALRWGFHDHSTFSRSFRRRFGCSPREFRDAAK